MVTKNKKKYPLSKFVLVLFTGQLVAKIVLIATTYSYVFMQMGIWSIIYYFLTLVQSDFLILGIGLLLAIAIRKRKFVPVQVFLLVSILGLFMLYCGDLLAILFFQQRLSFTSGSTFLHSGNDILLLYASIFGTIYLGVLIGSAFLTFLRKKKKPQKLVFMLMVLSFLIYAIPLPHISYFGIELPQGNILDKVARTSYQIALEPKQVFDPLIPKKELPLSPEELEMLKKRKAFWMDLALNTPERIFETFKHSALKKAKDQYGDSYVLEVLTQAVGTEPELAFKYLESYKDYETPEGERVLKPLLQVAIKKTPELAFRYLPLYQDSMQNNEKIAKSLLNYAVQHYKDPLTFPELFHEIEGRKNKKNLILIFLESASVVDSLKIGGLNDRMPLLDRVSDEGLSFTQVHANGMSSDMGHIATLMGVEPVVFDYGSGTRYQNYYPYTTPLASFFNQLGYHTVFLSTASLDFLDQKSFLQRVGYSQLIGPEAFEGKKRYTFDAAPDGDLYDKAIEFVKEQKSPYFLTLQTISSHTPYSTPYGSSAEEMYRYQDESFAKFYQYLKASNFFDNGILIVMGDHRKMTPLEDDEFAKWGTTSAAKIITFIIGKGIKRAGIDQNIYQQTDLFYSLLAEFGSGKVQVLRKYNDFFTQKIARDRSVKHRYDQKKTNIADKIGNDGYIDLNRMEIMHGRGLFPEEEILNYLKLSITYQEQQKRKQGQSLDEEDHVVLISHRGHTEHATENSLHAFQEAFDLGAEGAEMDIAFTKDQKIVVYHGPKLHKLTQCKEETRDICQLTRKELQECPLNDGQKIEELEVLLPKMKNWFSMFFLDIKEVDSGRCPEQDLVQNTQRIIDVVKKNKLDAKTILSSYDPEVSIFLGGKADITSALDSFSLKALDKLPDSFFSYFMTPSDNFSTTLVEKLQKSGIDGVAYTVNDVKTLLKLKDMGVRFVITDELSLLKKALEELKH